MDRVLAIESSCDDCAAAVLTMDGTVLSNVIYTQIEEHAPFGGVVPEVAARSHLEKISVVVSQALDEAAGSGHPRQCGDSSEFKITKVAVTTHPGLVGALLVGAMFAKGFAQAQGCEIIGINHLEGHLMAGSNLDAFPSSPYIALIVSGGHTALYKIGGDGRDPLHHELLGDTRDDAAGEAFDKVAKMLGLGYPGGKVVDELAQIGDATRFKFPRALRGKETLDFSFSGLKTSVRYLIRDLEKEHGCIDAQTRNDICAGMREAVADILIRKSVQACKREGIRFLVLGGGVAANSLLRDRASKLAADEGIEAFVPPRKYCTDNAVMIGLAGIARFKRGESSDLFALGVSSRA